MVRHEGERDVHSVGAFGDSTDSAKRPQNVFEGLEEVTTAGMSFNIVQVIPRGGTLKNMAHTLMQKESHS